MLHTVQSYSSAQRQYCIQCIVQFRDMRIGGSQGKVYSTDQRQYVQSFYSTVYSTALRQQALCSIWYSYSPVQREYCIVQLRDIVSRWVIGYSSTVQFTDSTFQAFIVQFYSTALRQYPSCSTRYSLQCFRLKFYSPLLSKNSVETARFSYILSCSYS